MRTAEFEKTFEGWRAVAREFLREGLAPHEILWPDQNFSLFDQVSVAASPNAKVANPVVPRDFLNLAESVSFSNDPGRWSLLYRLLYRIRFENPNLMSIHVDADVHRAQAIAKSVRRDIHKMHAFVRFKRDDINGQEIYRAWHQPEHPCLRIATPFFARRFGDKRWSIFTPEESAHWDLQKLTFGPGLEQHEFQSKDNWDEIWKTYYQSIFNPARLNIKMMKQEMSPKYWASMPETALIHELVRKAPARLQKMASEHRRAADVSASAPLEEVAVSARGCQACPLFQSATQTVFGEGPSGASIMIVGEQPGDEEDRAGRPFVGPAGEVLDRALAAAGLDRSKLYLTNAVKHFKWTPSSDQKTRIHKKASGSEMHACKPWLEAEIARIKPQIIIALGTTAGTAVLGRLPKITSERGRWMGGHKGSAHILLSWHPAAILRADTPTECAQRERELIADLKLVARAATENHPSRNFFVSPQPTSEI